MKRKLLSGIMLLVLAFSACKKEEKTESTHDTNNSNGDTAGMASMSAQINGQNWKATGISATLLISSHTGTRGLSINGYSSDKLIVPAFEEAGNTDVLTNGSYDFEEAANYSMFSFCTILPNGNKQTEHIPVSGTVTVTSADAINKKISGTFSFQVVKAGTTDTLKVTDGVFTDVMYTVSKK